MGEKRVLSRDSRARVDVSRLRAASRRVLLLNRAPDEPRHVAPADLARVMPALALATAAPAPASASASASSSRRRTTRARPAASVREWCGNIAISRVVRRDATAAPRDAHTGNGSLDGLEPLVLTVFSTSPCMKTTQTRVLEASFPGRVRCVEAALDVATAPLAAGSNAVCLFVNDDGGADVVNALADQGVRFIAMRCAGFDRIDLDACAARGIAVARVPAYSPYAVAEHAIALMLALNRQLIKSNARVLQGNYSLSGLVGFDMHGKTVGVVGTGKARSVLFLQTPRACIGPTHVFHPSLGVNS